MATDEYDDASYFETPAGVCGYAPPGVDGYGVPWTAAGVAAWAAGVGADCYNVVRQGHWGEILSKHTAGPQVSPPVPQPGGPLQPPAAAGPLLCEGLDPPHP